MSTLQTPLSIDRRLRGVATSMVLAALSACSVLTPKSTAPPAFYALDDTLAATTRPAASPPCGGFADPDHQPGARGFWL
jgi:hypothetical protein